MSSSSLIRNTQYSRLSTTSATTPNSRNDTPPAIQRRASIQDHNRNGWVANHLRKRGHEFLCTVPDDYMCDRFNVTLLNERVEHFSQAWRLLTNRPRANPMLQPRESVQRAAETLYGLIHARYVLSPEGCADVLHKFEGKEYGTCPRVLCEGCAMLPVGLSDQPGVDTVKLYCARCDDVYRPHTAWHASLDGAYFGTGLPHMLFMEHPEVRPPPLAKSDYQATLYGFKLFAGRNNRTKNTSTAPIASTSDRRDRGRSQCSQKIF